MKISSLSDRSILLNNVTVLKGVSKYPAFIEIRLLLVIRSVSDVLPAQSRFVKFVGGGAAGRTPYIFYKPTLGPKYVSNIPYNEFITPTTFISLIIGIFDGFRLPIFDVGYTLDSKYAVT